MVKRAHLISLVLCVGAIGLCGCTTVAVYQSPVAQFQTAVNSASDGVRTYLLGVNDVIAKGNLYDKVGVPITSGPDWVATPKPQEPQNPRYPFIK